jgi:hypothetical protein
VIFCDILLCIQHISCISELIEFKYAKAQSRILRLRIRILLIRQRLPAETQRIQTIGKAQIKFTGSIRLLRRRLRRPETPPTLNHLNPPLPKIPSDQNPLRPKNPKIQALLPNHAPHHHHHHKAHPKETLQRPSQPLPATRPDLAQRQIPLRRRQQKVRTEAGAREKE